MKVRFFALLALCFSAAVSAADFAPFVPLLGSGSGLTLADGDARYLKLDASNDPVTAALDVGAVAASPRLEPTGTAALPAFTFAGETTLGMYRVGAGLLGWSVGGVERARLSSTAFSNQTATGSFNIAVAAGTAAAPTYSFAGETNMGMYRVAAGELGLGTGAALRLSMSSTNGLVSTLPVRAPAGSAATPSFSFTGATGTGLHGSASTLSLDVGGAEQAFIGSTGTMFLSSAGGGLFTTTGAADGNQNFVGSGQLFAEFGNGAASAASFGVRSGVVEAAPVNGVRFFEAVVACTGSACTTSATTAGSIVSEDANGSSVEGVKVNATALNIGAINGHVGTAPTALPTCSSTIRGEFRYKEDTDTAATNPALCFCMRNDAALTFAWVKLAGGGTC